MKTFISAGINEYGIHFQRSSFIVSKLDQTSPFKRGPLNED